MANYLLKDDGDKILQETGDGILIEQSVFEKIVSDNVSFLEVVAKSDSVTVSDSLLFTEAKVLEIEKILAENLNLNVVALKSAFEKILAENLNLNVVALKSTFEKVFDETLTLAESLIKLMTFEKTFTETEFLVETFSEESGKTLSDSILFLKTLQKDLRLFSSDTFILNEAKKWEFGKEITDSLNLTAVLLAERGLLRTDIISLADSVSRILEAKRSFSETFSLVENIAPITIFRKILADTLALAETLTKFTGLSFVDSVSFSEYLLTSKGFNKEQTETICFLSGTPIDYGDTIMMYNEPLAQYNYYPTPRFNVGKYLSEDLTLLEVSFSEKTFNRNFSETLTFIESFSKGVDLKKIDNVLLNEILKKLSDISLTLTETLSLSESLKTIIGIRKTDSLILSESLIKKIALQKTENLTLAEIFALSLTIKRLDTLIFNESLTKEEKFVLTDLFSLSEVIRKQIDIPKGETLILSESLEIGSDKKLIEAIDLDESFKKSIQVDLVDDLALIEYLVKTSVFNLPLRDAIALVDLLSFYETEPLLRKIILLTKGQKSVLLTKGSRTSLTTKQKKTTLFSK